MRRPSSRAPHQVQVAPRPLVSMGGTLAHCQSPGCRSRFRPAHHICIVHFCRVVATLRCDRTSVEMIYALPVSLILAISTAAAGETALLFHRRSRRTTCFARFNKRTTWAIARTVQRSPWRPGAAPFPSGRDRAFARRVRVSRRFAIRKFGDLAAGERASSS
jgi:hypothetical protein